MNSTAPLRVLSGGTPESHPYGQDAQATPPCAALFWPCMKRPAPSVIVVCITILLDVLGIGIIIPVGPKLLEIVMGLPTRGAEAQASLTYGLLAATYSAMMFIFAPILGSLSDKVGRRPVILFALFGSGLDYLAAIFAPNIAATFGPTIGVMCMFIMRAINGITGANISACNAYLADVTPPEKRAAAFGMMGAMFGLGFAFGPLLGGVLGDIDVRLPFAAAGVLTLINWLYGCFVLPESLPAERRRGFSWQKANPFGALTWLLHHHVVTTIAAMMFLLNVAQFALHATWVLSMSKRFEWGAMETGFSLCLVGIGAMVVQGFLVRKLIPALGERASVLIGLGIGVLAFLGYGLATQGWMIYAIIIAASLGGIAGPAAQAIASKAVPPTEQGLLQGALSGLGSIAGIVGYIFGGAIFAYFSRDGAPINLPGAPFIAGSIITLLSIIPLLVIWRHLPSSVRQAPIETVA